MTTILIIDDNITLATVAKLITVSADIAKGTPRTEPDDSPGNVYVCAALEVPPPTEVMDVWIRDEHRGRMQALRREQRERERRGWRI